MQEQQQQKSDPYHPSLPYVVTINGFQVLLSSITCLPTYPTQGRYLPYSSLPSMHGSFKSASDPQDNYPIPCTFIPGIKVD